MTIIQFLSAFGLGAIVTALIQAYLSHRSYIAKRNFQEKKEAYIGLLKAMNDQMKDGSTESSIEAGHWIYRVELVGSEEVINNCHKMLETNPGSPNSHKRKGIEERLREAMREDLAVGKKLKAHTLPK